MENEKEMMSNVLEYVSEKYKKNFFDNIQAFRWEEENRIKASIRKNETNLVLFLIKKDDSGFDPNVRESILKIYRELPLPVPPIYEKFKESLSNSKTILITLRVKDENGEIVGYVKGAPLETYELRPGTFDYNVRKKEHRVYGMDWY